MVQLSFIKEKKRMANAHTKKLDLNNERSYFKKHPVKSNIMLTTSKCSRLSMTTYLLYLVDVFLTVSIPVD
jgi:hypothetical protein